MKKILFPMIALAFALNGCLPAALQPAQATNPPALDLNATAAILSQQTLNALPSQTLEPSSTPQVLTPTQTPTQATATETINPILLTLTATLGTGTVTSNTSPPAAASTTGSQSVTITGTSSSTSNIVGTTPTETAHPLHSGTMPPNLPYGFIEIKNKSKADVYISMRCVTKEGNVTIIEYPVGNFVNAKGPAGKYTYVVWVGGRQILGSFSLGKNQDLVITIFKDRVAVK